MSNESTTGTTPATIPTIEAEARYTTRKGEFETCCICGTEMPVVYAPNGTPTDIGMYNPWPLVSEEMTDAYGFHCCCDCMMIANRAEVALHGDADALEGLAEELADCDLQTVPERLRGLAEGLRTRRMVEAVSRDTAFDFDSSTDTDAEPTDAEILADVAEAYRDALATMRGALAKVNYLCDRAEREASAEA